MDKITVVVLFGGQSTEHEVSRTSAVMALSELDRDKYEVLPVGITKEGRWLLCTEASMDEVASGEWEEKGVSAFLSPDASKRALIKLSEDGTEEIPVDVVLPMLHGAWGEDGCVQGLLELARIPYVGCGVLSSAVAMDKVCTKILAQHFGIPQPKFLWADQAELKRGRRTFLSSVEEKLKYPCFVKPANTGSSVGISMAKNRTELNDALALASRYDHKIIVEEGIDGREFECAVLGNDEIEVSGAGEVFPMAEFYDYNAKYHSVESHTVIPAEIPAEKEEEMQSIAERVYRIMGAQGIARVDFFMERRSGKILFNEINTIPGFTPISMFPMLWEERGMKKSELMDRMIELALTRDAGIRG